MPAIASEPLKIAFCLPDQDWLAQMATGDPKDAAHIQQLYIANGLRARGHSLTFIAPRGVNQLICTNDLNRPMIAVQTWTQSKWFDWTSRVAWKTQQLLRVSYLNFFSNLRRYDAALRCLPGHTLAFERNGLYNVGIAMACKKLALPYIMFFDADQIVEHDYMNKPITGWLRWRAKQILCYNLDVASRIVCVSEPARRHLIANWQVPSHKIAVLPNGVDVQRFQPDSIKRTQTRTTLRLSDQPLIIFVGSFHKWHDVATLLNAFACVRTSCPDAHLLLVGDGSQREVMIQHAANLGIEQAVHFTGHVPHAQVSALVNAADIAVVPVPLMKQDPWLSPMKLFEYMAAGKPIVASALGQVTQVIRDNDNGLLVPPGNAAMLADALLRLIGDANLRERLGQQARADAVREYSWEKHVASLEGVFARVLAEHAAPKQVVA